MNPNFDTNIHKNFVQIAVFKLKDLKVGENGVLEKRGALDRVHSFFSKNYENKLNEGVKDIFKKTVEYIEKGMIDKTPVKVQLPGMSKTILTERMQEYGKTFFGEKNAYGEKLPDDLRAIIDPEAQKKLGSTQFTIKYERLKDRETELKRESAECEEKIDSLGQFDKEAAPFKEKQLIINQELQEINGKLKDLYEQAQNKTSKFAKDLLKSDINEIKVRLENPPIEEEKSPAELKQELIKKQAELDGVRGERRILKAGIASKMGVVTEAAGGATGTLKILDSNGKPLGVLKSDQATNKVRLLNFFKKKKIFESTRGQLSFLSQAPNAQPLSEVAAYKLNNYFGFGMAPFSTKANLLDREGIFQTWVKTENKKENKTVPADQVPIFDRSDEKTQTAFQKMAIFDMLIGNLDRHKENWMVEVKKGKAQARMPKTIEKMTAIDNANAFPVENPKKGQIKNQFIWKEEPLADKPLTEESMELLRQMKDKGIEGFIAELKVDPDLGNFLNEAMETRLRERFNFLINSVREDIKYGDKNPTPAQLADQYFAFNNENRPPPANA